MNNAIIALILAGATTATVLHTPTMKDSTSAIKQSQTLDRKHKAPKLTDIRFKKRSKGVGAIDGDNSAYAQMVKFTRKHKSKASALTEA